MFSLLAVYIFILGLIIGSFLNCLIWRSYKEESLGGRSRCPKCQKQIAWYDNIPVLSWLLLRGRCRHCQQSISIQYPLVEIITAFLFVGAFLKLNPSGDFNLLFGLTLLNWLIAISALVVIFVYDYRWFLISVPMLLVFGGLIFILDLLTGVSIWPLVGAVVVAVIFFGLQFVLTKGRGLGEGDIWLGGLMGLIFPRPALLLTAIFISYIIGLIVSVILLASKTKGLKSRLPLGVFLAAGSIITLFWGANLLNWYLAFF